MEERSAYLEHVAESVALLEGRACDHACRLGQSERGEMAAECEGAVLNEREGSGQTDCAEGGAGRECTRADSGQRCGESHAGESGATVKEGSRKLLKTLGQDDAAQSGAMREGVTTQRAERAEVAEVKQAESGATHECAIADGGEAATHAGANDAEVRAEGKGAADAQEGV